MLEHLPRPIGRALRGVRAGFEKVASESKSFAQIPDAVALTSPAFEDGGAIPARYTADGEKISPPLAWADVPEGTAALAILVEDPDSPSLEPFVHLLVWDLPADLSAINEGLFSSSGHAGVSEDLGRNSYLKTAWLPLDPPTGHGPHLYVFQIFALATTLEFDRPPGRKTFLETIEGHVLARGMLIGTYERP